MIVSSTVTGKMDRPSGIVSFQASKDPSESLNDWARSLNKLMGLISRTTHLINKEEMVWKCLKAGPSGLQLVAPSQAMEVDN
jgi:26S proteasome regulatory subunit N5